MKTTLFNGIVITPLDTFKGGVVIDDKKITAVFKGEEFEKAGLLVDCKLNYIAPGFVDLHTHACFGGDVMDATVESLQQFTLLHGNHGTTSLMATTLSSGHDKIKRAVENVKVTMSLPPKGARIIGVHLEGNYFAREMAGAQNPAFLYPPSEDDYMDFVNTGIVKRIAAAPELEGALEMARKLAPMGIQMSIGHSNGKPADVEKAIAAGFTTLTHIFNAESALTSVFLYPDGGVSEGCLIHDEIRVECICDGNHLSPTLLKLIYKVKGADGMIAVTDSVYAGAPDGDYDLGGLSVTVGNNICTLKNGKAFAGSVATMDLCARILYKKAGICIQDVVRICSSTPARTVNEHNHIGYLAEGFDADINVFDDDINIKFNMILGEVLVNQL